MNRNVANLFLSRRRGQQAFSVIEIIIVSALMAVIVFGLLLMFTQTQKAYRLGTSQVDIMEGGRATMDLIGREVAAMTPSDRLGVVNFSAPIPNFPPLLQALSGGVPALNRTNVIHDLYFLSRENTRWRGIGYHVAKREAGLGTLYRYEDTAHYSDNPGWIFTNFSAFAFSDITTNFGGMAINRILDGVVHFRIRAFSTNGIGITNVFQLAGSNSLAASTLIPGETDYSRIEGAAVPATVELELGVLEEEFVIQARAIPNITNRLNFLAQRAGNVQLFRLRVPIRNVDPAAYAFYP